ncbi:MAG: hypothetical protein AB7L92_03930 [Alphaproteobacteria bacterium]
MRKPVTRQELKAFKTALEHDIDDAGEAGVDPSVTIGRICFKELKPTERLILASAAIDSLYDTLTIADAVMQIKGEPIAEIAYETFWGRVQENCRKDYRMNPDDALAAANFIAHRFDLFRRSYRQEVQPNALELHATWYNARLMPANTAIVHLGVPNDSFD